jgi:hypothetical protein
MPAGVVQVEAGRRACCAGSARLSDHGLCGGAHEAPRSCQDGAMSPLQPAR